MKKIILAAVILFPAVFSFDKSFAQSDGGEGGETILKGCPAYLYIDSDTTAYNIKCNCLTLDRWLNPGDSILCSISGYLWGLVWFRGTDTVSTDINPYAITDTGNYFVRATIGDGIWTCAQWVGSAHINVHPSQISAISEISNPNILQIYPNPTNNNFTIKNISASEISLLQIINPTGAIVYTEKLYGKNEYLIDANFAKGIYFVRVNNVVRKLIVD